MWDSEDHLDCGGAAEFRAGGTVNYAYGALVDHNGDQPAGMFTEFRLLAAAGGACVTSRHRDSASERVEADFIGAASL